VSTDHQSLEGQGDALTAAGCERVFTDQVSGVRDDRPGLVALLGYVRAGDTVVVVAADRLGRSLSGNPHGRDADRGRCAVAVVAGGDRLLDRYRADAGGHLRCACRLRAGADARARRGGPGAGSIADLVRGFGVSRATNYRALAQEEVR